MKLYLYLLAFICLTVSCENSKAIDSSSYGVSGKWILQNQSVFDSVLNFRKQTIADSNLFWAKEFEFSDSNISYSAINAITRCGNGIFYLDSTNYKAQVDTVSLFLKGGYTLGSKFLYHANYKIYYQIDSSFSLKRIEIIIDDRKEYWESLIKKID